MSAGGARRRFLAPEVVQTSAMDCGPASLKSLLEGFGIHVDYDRLRDVCQTEVDGTSIDTIEQSAVRLGLDAEQIMVPADHVMLAEANALPAVAVVRLPNGSTHFVLVWRRVGPLVQLMDPGTGRRWTTTRRFVSELYEHTMDVPAAAWRTWAASPEARAAVIARLQQIGVARANATRLFDDACGLPGWQALAAIDAATRMLQRMRSSGGVRLGRHAASVVAKLAAQAAESGAGEVIPDRYWSVRPSAGAATAAESLTLRGAVLVRARGRRAIGAPGASATPAEATAIRAALNTPPLRPLGHLFGLLHADGRAALLTLCGVAVIASAGVVTEALLLAGFLELGRALSTPWQRLTAAASVVALMAALLALEVPLNLGVLRSGRRLEMRVRLAFLQKIPRLGDRYFRTRLSSDLAHRAHTAHVLRHVPDLATRALRAVVELLLTITAIVWLADLPWPLALAVAVATASVPLILNVWIIERDMRLRTHAGALARFYLDGLVGSAPVRAHAAEGPMTGEHAALLSEWTIAGFDLRRLLVAAEAIQATITTTIGGWLVFRYLRGAEVVTALPLLAYWILRLPALSDELSQVMRQYPVYRNTALRLLEPLSAPGADPGLSTEPATDARADGVVKGVAISMHDVSLAAAGRPIISGVHLNIPAGAHVAIVGTSGAGKSTLVGALLGWSEPATGSILIDGAPLTSERLAALRQESAWVDPSVRLWNRGLDENIRYGTPDAPMAAIGRVVEHADLRGVVERMPKGIYEPLGEDGGLLSGGEGQRVRIARALLRPGARLAVLDEPFSGLDRGQRARLLERARGVWHDATLLYVTHDMAEAALFDRVIVVDRGRVVADGNPWQLAREPESAFARLVNADTTVQTDVWRNGGWRRVTVDRGRVRETPAVEVG